MTEYSLSDGFWWLINGNDLEMCYSEKQNGDDPTSPICYDLTGTDYVGIATSDEAMIIYALVVLVFKLLIVRKVLSKKAIYLH